MRRLQRPSLHLAPVLTTCLAVVLAAGCATATRADEPVARRGAGTDPAPPTPDVEALWAEALTFNSFLDGVRARRDAWHGNYRDAVVDDELVERLRALPGRYRLLAVSLDGCTDSVVNIPGLARLVERVPGLELRIVDAGRGRALMERHRTPDGRTATPTIVLLDGQFDVVGCWVERPAALQNWYLENKGTLPIEDVYAGLIEWYDADRGRTALREIAAMVEAAANGEDACRSGGPVGEPACG